MPIISFAYMANPGAMTWITATLRQLCYEVISVILVADL